MKKIWNEHTQTNMYAIDEQVLYKTIVQKRKKINRQVNILELSLIMLNTGVSIYLLLDAYLNHEGFWEYASGIIMCLTVVLIGVFRWKRRQKENTFDRSMLGELNYAIANSHSVLQIATGMIYLYLLPIGFITLAKMIYVGASLEKWCIIIGMYLLAFYLIYWERKTCHIPRKKRLLSLRKRLIEE